MLCQTSWHVAGIPVPFHTEHLGLWRERYDDPIGLIVAHALTGFLLDTLLSPPAREQIYLHLSQPEKHLPLEKAANWADRIKSRTDYAYTFPYQSQAFLMPDTIT